MLYGLIAVFVLLAAAAALFAAWPVLRGPRDTAKWILSAAIAFAVLGIGVGAYLMVGSPELALRDVTPLDTNDWRAVVAKLVANARARPTDPQAWTMLGRGYLLMHDGQDAAAAFRHALPYAAASQRVALLDGIAEALIAANDDAVTPEAEQALDDALTIDPKDRAARYFLGLAYAQRRDNARALAMWNGLLAEMPPGAPGRGVLLDRVAALTRQSGQAPDVNAMVAGLAARLKAQPADPEGWQRLVRSYAMLGDGAKAAAALADAHAALKGNAPALAALDAEAKQLGL
ncbi:MAG: tetratricopeptide repeat protein [Rhizomicrobium sp.]